jgi:magnesium transporter
VAGTHEIEGLQALGARFGLHPLTLEDVVNSGQRPKLENYDDHLFIVMRVIHSAAAVAGEQVSMYLGRSWVLTFEEIPEDAFDLVRERLRRGKGQIRSAGADYLAYSIVDAAVDHFFPVLETLGERIEALEEELVEDPDRRTLEKIHQLKRELLLIRRAAWPQREVISSLGRQESDLVHRETRVFLRDCYDHTIQIMDIVETYRDLASGMMDLYLSSVSHRTNEVMKVLTVIASIFIPLTFIAGIYGMNFNTKASPLNMPELNWYWGYPALWLVVIGLAAGMIVYFRRKRWI